jgi:hypothetical protein
MLADVISPFLLVTGTRLLIGNLLDLNTRELAFVAFGYSPVVVLDPPPATQVSTDTVCSPAHSPERNCPIK